jgi:hypothetical protein
MSKEKITISLSLPIRVKQMLQEIADKNYATKTKVVVDMIIKEYNYWFNKKEEDKVNE